MKKTPIKKEIEHVSKKEFDQSMLTIGQSFNRVQDVLEVILDEIRGIREDSIQLRTSVRILETENIARDRKSDSLRVRVERLESKVK